VVLLGRLAIEEKGRVWLNVQTLLGAPVRGYMAAGQGIDIGGERILDSAGKKVA